MVYCRNQNYFETGFDSDSNSSNLNNLDDFDWKSDYSAVHRRYDSSETVVSPHCCHVERMHLSCYLTSRMSAFLKLPRRSAEGDRVLFLDLLLLWLNSDEPPSLLLLESRPSIVRIESLGRLTTGRRDATGGRLLSATSLVATVGDRKSTRLNSSHRR